MVGDVDFDGDGDVDLDATVAYIAGWQPLRHTARSGSTMVDHLHVAVAVKVHDHVPDHVDVNAAPARCDPQAARSC